MPRRWCFFWYILFGSSDDDDDDDDGEDDGEDGEDGEDSDSDLPCICLFFLQTIVRFDLRGKFTIHV